MDVLVVDHPLAQTRLTAMRKAETDSGVFRAALHELTTMVVYEAARSFATERYPISTPVAPTEGTRLANPPLIVPVLRAGLGLADPGCTEVIVCCVLAAPEGIRRLEESGLPLRLVTASIDEGLNEKAYIVPGLGDAGDRQFGGMRRF